VRRSGMAELLLDGRRCRLRLSRPGRHGTVRRRLICTGVVLAGVAALVRPL
jgi:hypothetical protein